MRSDARAGGGSLYLVQVSSMIHKPGGCLYSVATRTRCVPSFVFVLRRRAKSPCRPQDAAGSQDGVFELCVYLGPQRSVVTFMKCRISRLSSYSSTARSRRSLNHWPKGSQPTGPDTKLGAASLSNLISQAASSVQMIHKQFLKNMASENYTFQRLYSNRILLSS